MWEGEDSEKERELEGRQNEWGKEGQRGGCEGGVCSC